MTSDPLMPGAAVAARVPVVVVVGAGFSGAVTAVQLLRRAEGPVHVVLVNESGRMARGLAYGTRSAQHLLNVPAGNMSALDGEPDDFLHYCRWSAPQVQPDSFVPRRAYGAYLEALLSAAEVSLKPGARLERVTGAVVHARPVGQGAVVQLRDGRLWQADAVVLAFGHFAPRAPLSAEQLQALGPRWIADPWAPGALQGVGARDDVLLVGSGLTAVDVALGLADTGHRGRITCISRRGLAPQAHRASGGLAAQVDGQALAARLQGQPTRQQLRALREAVRRHQAAGGDWRDVVGALRGHTPAWWRALPQAQRAQFLRHLRPHWEVLRHRCAPQAHAQFERLQQQGRLQLLAARLGAVAVDEAQGAVQLQLHPRGGKPAHACRVQHVVNCTGPTSDLRHSGSALLDDLQAQGLLARDALGLGLPVDAAYHPIGRGGGACGWLYYVGPLLKADAWEATAVPELRRHARCLAEGLLATLGVDAPPPGLAHQPLMPQTARALLTPPAPLAPAG